MGLIGSFSLIQALLTPSDETATLLTANRNHRGTESIQNAESAAKGLDLRLVSELLKQARSAEEFEKLLNSKEHGVNNLDLNGNGTVDYISVTEFIRDDERNFSLSVEPVPGQKQEIAIIRIEKADDGQSARVEAHGNPRFYGPDHSYSSGWTGPVAGMMLGYLFGRMHTPWTSPFSQGRHPPGYQPYPAIGHDTYQNKHAGKVPEGTYKSLPQKNGESSYASQKKQNSVYHQQDKGKDKRSLHNPDRSQRKFQSRTRGKEVRRGGFGRSARRPAMMRRR